MVPKSILNKLEANATEKHNKMLAVYKRILPITLETSKTKEFVQ